MNCKFCKNIYIKVELILLLFDLLIRKIKFICIVPHWAIQGAGSSLLAKNLNLTVVLQMVGLELFFFRKASENALALKTPFKRFSLPDPVHD